MTAFYRLVVRSGPNVGTAYPLEKNEIFIGRELSNDIVLNDPEMSRRHSRLYVQGNSYVIEDLGSTNGTSVNGQRLMGPYPLRPGELVTFGEHVTMMFDAVQPDQAATVVSQVQPSMPQPQRMQPAAPPPMPAPQVYTPPPVQPTYTPQPAFSGQVPMQPGMEEPVEQKRRIPLWLLILLVLLVVVCICGVLVFAIDYFNLWCSLFPFLFGSACG